MQNVLILRKNMKISVIIPTYNGAQKVGKALHALAQQTIQDFEVIVVIDGSTDNTAQILGRQDFGLKNLKIIEQANGGRSVSRNNGAKEATGELLVFLDDDTRPLNQCLEMHITHHEKYPNTFLVGNVPEDTAQMTTDFQKYKAHLSRKWVSDIPQGVPFTQQTLFLTAANFSTPQTLFWQASGFDEQLTDAEDFDLGVRAFQKGIPVYFDKQNIAWHDDFITCSSYLRRLKQYAKAHEKLIALKPALYSTFNQYQPQALGILKKLAYAFFAHNFWVTSIDDTHWLRIFPRKIRYKLYDIITTAHTRKKQRK